MSVLSLALPPSGIRVATERALSRRLVPIIRSSPGMGKSEIMQSIADEYDLKLIDFRLGQADVTDLNGLPRFLPDGRAEFAPFSDFPLEGDELPIKHDADGKVIYETISIPQADGSTAMKEVPARYKGWLLFFDEITSAGKQIQAAAYKVLLERKIGNHKLHKAVAMAAAGNLETDNAVVYEMSTALQSRIVHLEMRLDHKEWYEWAISNGIDSRIIGFLHFRSGLLHDFKPDHTDRTFACPRTWYFASKLIQGRKTLDEVDRSLLGGTVGAGVAAEFMTFVDIYQTLPKIDDIVRDPMGAPVPSEASIKYALATVIAESFDDKSVDPLVQYLRRFPVEHQVICMRMARTRNKAIMRHKSTNELFVALVKQM